MPRSSFSRNPLLRVSRPVSACRSAKVKCDGKLPACTACEKAGRESECSAANDQFARGKERSYVAALELRIEKLERRLQFAKSRKASVANHEHEGPFPNDMNRKDSLTLIKAAIHRKAARTRENSDVNSLVSDFGYMSVNAVARDFEPEAFNVTFAGLVLTATMNNALPASTEPDLPPKQVTHSIMQYFMTHIYTLFPCFSETALLTVISDLYQEDHRVIRDSDYWLMYMVLAIGYTAQSQQVNDTNYECGVEYVVKALKYADQALAPGTGTQIQSLLLLTIYSLLDPAHFDSWHLLGFTARACVDLGFHQDPPTSSSSDRTALDIRRRIFYSVYALDRAISMVHARTFSFTDDSINVAFPASISLRKQSLSSGPIAAPQSTDPALLLFQLRRAQSYWYQELYQSDTTPLTDPTTFLWQMCLDMREWGESLPDSLPPGIRRMFEQELRYSYVYCIAPSVRAPQITDYSRTLIFEYSLEYLNIMLEISRTGLNSAFYTYHDALKVYFMGNQLLAVLRDAEEVLLSGRPVPPPPLPLGCPPAPPIPRRTALPTNDANDALERSLWCLERRAVGGCNNAQR
ncbi:Positive regulator of purine utilization [Beauveria bassiana]|nr:Positive regulator of purine utilization [Beauveria bassiana]